MSQDGFANDEMRYDLLAQEALRGVVRSALKRAAQPEGLPGEHHFYITFKTTAPGVSLPADLAATYPNEMTVVLQNQFWDLAPGETFFSVMLSFDRQPKRLSIPYAAITRFFDPSVQFMLKFEVPEGAAPAEPPKPVPVEADAEPVEEGPKVVSLDQFRKK
ncbi:MAG TPA: ClpXP protease specificity-enhancing factor SspB [Caulobacteraceae bacterium]|jgi:hypothetical protein